MTHLSTTMLGSGFYVAMHPWRSQCGARAALSPVRSEPNVIDVPDRNYSEGEVALIEDHIAEMLVAGTVIGQFEEHIFATHASPRHCVEGWRMESRRPQLLSANRLWHEQNDR